MNELISPSRLAIEAAGMHPKGSPASEPGCCSLCGHAYAVGDLVASAAMPDTFTNWGEIASPGSPFKCGYCATVVNDPWTQAWMNAVICREGVFKFASNADIAAWLLNPPEGPFVMTKGDQQRQHLVWRTPVNYNREIFRLRIGEKLVTIRRQHLQEARDAAIKLSDLMKLERESDAKRGRKPAREFINPFIAVAREMDSLQAGQIRQEALALAVSNPEADNCLKTLLRCTPGEIWGLTAVLYAEPSSEPTKHQLKSQ